MGKKEQRIQDNILFLGNRDDVYRLYQAMDVFVLPSRYEGLPVVGVEAQAAGLPCVLSDQMTAETKMTDSASFQSIEADSKIWALTILKNQNIRNINGLPQKFDINCQAVNLENFYRDILN